MSTPTYDPKLVMATFGEHLVTGIADGTFIEVEQPEGIFLFRMKSDKGLWCSLHEIHTNWKRQAAISVKEYLENQVPLKGFTILA